jgi:glycolate oxidase FAD binding subunit
MSSPDSALRAITDQVREAAASGAPLRIRGGGSKDFYGAASSGEAVGQLLDTRPWAGITSYEPSELVVTVRAGTPLAELEAALADKGQCLPFEPPHFQIGGIAAGSQATVGGMVAAGLSGPARASVGGVRDYILGVQILNGRAELLSFGGTVMKNVAGYDVSRLMAGAMGTLGVITEVSLKVLPVAPAEASLVFELDQAQALTQLHVWGAQPLPLNASRWESTPVKADEAAASANGQLWLRLRGAVAAVEAACVGMLKDTPGQRIDNTVAAADWQACRDLRLPFFTRPPMPGMALWRLSVAQTAPVLNLPWPQLMEWHGGLRWCWAPLDAAAKIRDTARQAGGHATVFIANYAYPMRENTLFYCQEALKPPLDSIHSRLKAEFDPAGIFNRNRLFPQD